MGVTHANVQRLLSMYLIGGENGQYDSAAALDTLATIARPASLTALISSITADSDLVESCAARSFHHPLGFDKIMLVNCSPLYTLRIHAWWPFQTCAAEHVHNHRFDFLSFVLRGGYCMQTFRPATDGIAMTRYQEALGSDRNWELRKIGPAYIQPADTRVLKQGAGYALRSDVLHKVTVEPNTLCFTMFLQTMPVRDTTEVYTRREQIAPIQTVKETLDAQAYRGKLADIASGLSCGPDAYAFSP
jgi:hypothetical protein